jgi:hypothetical protein
MRVTLSTLLMLIAVAPAWGQEGEPVDVSGAWEITSESPRGTMTRTVVFEQDGTALTGTMESQMGSVPIENGSVEGNTFTFTVTFSRGDRSFELKYSGTVDGDTATGTMSTPRGESEWTGKRVETE